MTFLKRLHTRGGVHPEGMKSLSEDCPIAPLPLPDRLYVPLQQHIGAPASPVVHVGERVRKGQLMAAGTGPVSAPVHAPTSGRILALGDALAPHPSGLGITTLTLEPDGDEAWLDTAPPADPFALAPEEIARRVGAAGIVGLGGAAFPSAVKLNLSRRSSVEVLVLNGSECEPYLTCDDRLMRERAAEIVDGIRLMNLAVGARDVLVGIEDNKPEALAAMTGAAAGTGIRIVAVPALYPMGSEKQMILALTGREVPAGGRAADIGVLVHNVATAYAVRQAIVLGHPLVSRVVTVSGGAVQVPRNVEALVGTPVQTLIDYCGGFSQAPARVVLGGPMMGSQISNTSVPVIKGTSGVLALTRAEIGQPEPAPCIRCSSCVRACPVGLLPLEMASRIRAGDLAAAVEFGLKDCIACGSCAYICPAHIPLVHFFNYAKGELAARERTRMKQDATRQLAEERNLRMERIAREREEAAARRKAEKAARDAAKKAAASPPAQAASTPAETETA